MNIAIIGGGAAGLMAALAVPPQHQVLLLERQARVGRKLLATGNGRCNLTNQNLTPANYHGSAPDFARYALAQFGPAQTLDFFACTGSVSLSTEPGRPGLSRLGATAPAASSTCCAWRWPSNGVSGWCAGCGGHGAPSRPPVLPDAAAEAPLRRRPRHRHSRRRCRRQAGRRRRGGYQLLEALGHRCTELYPSLAQLRTDPTYRPLPQRASGSKAVVTLLRRQRAPGPAARGRCSSQNMASAAPRSLPSPGPRPRRRPRMAVVLDLLPRGLGCGAAGGAGASAAKAPGPDHARTY